MWWSGEGERSISVGGRQKREKWIICLLVLLCAAGIVSGCGQRPEGKTGTVSGEEDAQAPEAAGEQGPEAAGYAGEQGPEAGGYAGEQGPEAGGHAREQGPEAGGHAGEQGPEAGGHAGEQGPEAGGYADRQGSGTAEEDGAVAESVRTEKTEQDTVLSADENNGESLLQWQIYIHPDVPGSLEEVLEQYELAMNAETGRRYSEYGTVEEILKKSGITGPCYVDDEIYGAWHTAVEAGWDSSICYGLQDLTGDSIPELIMGIGTPESVHIKAIYEDTAQGEIRMTGSGSCREMALHQEGFPEYAGGEMEFAWYSLTSPDWHIPVASNASYDVYLEGNSTDLWLARNDVRQLYFSIYDKEGTLVQELVESSPWLPYMPNPYTEGIFYFEDMNFDGIQDLMLPWVRINHPQWMAYLWREEEGVFREEPESGLWERESSFGYYSISKEKKYIDETVPEGSGYTIYRRCYDREREYYCVGALFVYFGDEEGTQEEEEEQYKEYFYRDGIYQGCTEKIPWEEVSEIWSDLQE